MPATRAGPRRCVPCWSRSACSRRCRSPFTVEPGFEPLFNGRDLTGWGYRATTEQEKVVGGEMAGIGPERCGVAVRRPSRSASTGRTTSVDGRWRVIGDRIAAITPAEYRKVSQLWTTKSFEGDFVLKLEFRATAVR